MQINASRDPQGFRPKPLASLGVHPHLLPYRFHSGKETGWGLGDTDQHEEEDEGHNIGQVRYRLQDDPNDIG